MALGIIFGELNRIYFCDLLMRLLARVLLESIGRLVSYQRTVVLSLSVIVGVIEATIF